MAKSRVSAKPVGGGCFIHSRALIPTKRGAYSLRSRFPASTMPGEEREFSGVLESAYGVSFRSRLLYGAWRGNQEGLSIFTWYYLTSPTSPKKTLQLWWEACTGENTSIVHVKLLRGKRRVFYYLSKYCAKPTNGDAVTSLDTNAYMHAEGKPSLSPAIERARDRDISDHEEADGRVWGVFQKWMLPYAKFTAWEIPDLDHALYLRWRGLQTAKVKYCPSRYSNIQFLEFGGGGRSLAPPEELNKLEHHLAARLASKYNWY